MSEEYEPLKKVDHENKIVALCAWCKESEELSKKYQKMGYMATHGVCKKHVEELLKEVKSQKERM
jgi:hypothetical protein